MHLMHLLVNIFTFNEWNPINPYYPLLHIINLYYHTRIKLQQTPNILKKTLKTDLLMIRKSSHTVDQVVYPIIYRVLYTIPGGAFRFLPSTIICLFLGKPWRRFWGGSLWHGMLHQSKSIHASPVVSLGIFHKPRRLNLGKHVILMVNGLGGLKPPTKIWKNMRASQIGSWNPQVRMNMKKCLSCHHLENSCGMLLYFFSIQKVIFQYRDSSYFPFTLR